MNKITLSVLQFLFNFYQKVENIDDIFIELSKDKRFPEDLRSDFASASRDIDYCYTVLDEAIDFVRKNEFPENGNQDSDKTNGKPRN